MNCRHPWYVRYRTRFRPRSGPEELGPEVWVCSVCGAPGYEVTTTAGSSRVRG